MDKDQLVTPGGPSTLTCQLLQASESITQCQILTPQNDVWDVIDDKVLNQSGAEVPGYSAAVSGDATKNCGITIQSVNTNQNDIGMYRRYTMSKLSKCVCDHSLLPMYMYLA